MNAQPITLDHDQRGAYAPGASMHRQWSKPLNTKVHWSYDQRAMALAVYADCGSAHEASNLTGIPHSTINGWVNSVEGIEEIEQLRLAIRSRVGHIYAALAVKSAMVVMDRLDNGDEVILANGDSVRRKMSGRDATMTCAVFTDKHALITGMLERERATDASLNKLANQLLTRMAALAPEAQAPRVDPPPPQPSPYMG